MARERADIQAEEADLALAPATDIPAPLPANWEAFTDAKSGDILYVEFVTSLHAFLLFHVMTAVT